MPNAPFPFVRILLLVDLIAANSERIRREAFTFVREGSLIFLVLGFGLGFGADNCFHGKPLLVSLRLPGEEP
jgi:hypothetical protein